VVKVAELNIDEVHPNPNQPRQRFDEDTLQELADSIKEVGLLQPILVRPNGDGFQIVHGERRWRACQMAGLETIRAEMRELSDDEVYTISVIENEQREDLSPIETARALQSMMDAQGFTQATVAERVGKSRTWVTQKLRLLNLPGEVQTLVKDGQLSEAHGRQLLKLHTANMEGKVEDFAQRAASDDWTVARLQSEVDVAIAQRASERAEDDYKLQDIIAVAFYAGALCVLRHGHCFTDKPTMCLATH
jgi:ParB family chromosome partitioning protein